MDKCHYRVPCFVYFNYKSHTNVPGSFLLPPVGSNHKDKGCLSSVIWNIFLSIKFTIPLGDAQMEILVTTKLYPP